MGDANFFVDEETGQLLTLAEFEAKTRQAEEKAASTRAPSRKTINQQFSYLKSRDKALISENKRQFADARKKLEQDRLNYERQLRKRQLGEATTSFRTEFRRSVDKNLKEVSRDLASFQQDQLTGLGKFVADAQKRGIAAAVGSKLLTITGARALGRAAAGLKERAATSIKRRFLLTAGGGLELSKRELEAKESAQTAAETTVAQKQEQRKALIAQVKKDTKAEKSERRAEEKAAAKKGAKSARKAVGQQATSETAQAETAAKQDKQQRTLETIAEELKEQREEKESGEGILGGLKGLGSGITGIARGAKSAVGAIGRGGAGLAKAATSMAGGVGPLLKGMGALGLMTASLTYAYKEISGTVEKLGGIGTVLDDFKRVLSDPIGMLRSMMGFGPSESEVKAQKQQFAANREVAAKQRAGLAQAGTVTPESPAVMAAPAPVAVAAARPPTAAPKKPELTPAQQQLMAERGRKLTGRQAVTEYATAPAVTPEMVTAPTTAELVTMETPVGPPVTPAPSAVVAGLRAQRAAKITGRTLPTAAPAVTPETPVAATVTEARSRVTPDMARPERPTAVERGQVTATAAQQKMMSDRAAAISARVAPGGGGGKSSRGVENAPMINDEMGMQAANSGVI